jgi:rsbT antagonist protein RsbS
MLDAGCWSKPDIQHPASDICFYGVETMNGARIPILKIGRVLIVPIQVDMDDQTVIHLQERILSELERTGARGVLIDISLLEMVDSFIGRMLSDIAAMARIMDARTVVVGMQPAVAITLVELGLELKGVDTVLNVDEGFRLLRSEIDTGDEDEEQAYRGLSAVGKQDIRS